MSPRLRAVTAVVGLFVVGGISYTVSVRTPPGTPMEVLRDAGAISDRIDRWVLVCPEKTTAATVRYLKKWGYGDFAPGSIHRIARVVLEHPDASLDSIANDGDGGDEEDGTDNALQFRSDDCYRLQCNDATDAGLREVRLLPDGGFRHTRADGGEAPWCNSATRRGRVTPPCVIPDCWTLSDGGWNDDAVVDCRGTGPYGEFPGGAPRWRGCNVTPAAHAVGTQCVPVECSIVAGDDVGVLR